MEDKDVIQEMLFIWQNISNKEYSKNTSALKILLLCRLEEFLSSNISTFDYVRKTINESQLAIFETSKEHIENNDEKLIEFIKDFNKFSEQTSKLIFNKCIQNLNAETLNLENDKNKYQEILEVIGRLSSLAVDDVYIALDEKYNLSKKKYEIQ